MRTMKLRVVAKLAVIVSIVLFCIGVGFYSFAQLKMVNENKDADLLSLVPHDCLAVLETDNMEFLVNELSQVNYAAQLDTTLSRSKLLSAVFNNLTPYIENDGVHGLSNRLDRVMISLHEPVSADNIVIYFRVNSLDDGFLKSLVKNSSLDFVPKEEMYRGKKIGIYPLRDGNFIATYAGKGFLAVSLQKRLIEEVIDAERDKTSLKNDSTFMASYQPKRANFVTIYAHAASIPLLTDQDARCWSGFDLHFNNEVFYLSGSIDGRNSCIRDAGDRIASVQPVVEDSLLVLAGTEKVDSCISRLLALPVRDRFQECVANLSREASFIMVADMDKAGSDMRSFASFIPSFFSRHWTLFRPFILSVQITHVENRLSYLFVLSMKD